MEKTNKKAVGWLSLAHFMSDTYSGFLNPIMPFIAAKIGITMALAGVAVSLSHICSSLLQPVFGLFADNMRKRIFIFWGLIFTALFIPFAAIAPNFFILTALIILGSLGGSLLHPQAMGLVVKFSPKDFGRNMAIFISLGTFGFAFGPLISSSITKFFGLGALPWTCFIGLLVAALMFLFVPKLSHSGEKPEYPEFFKTLREIFQNNNIKILTAVAFSKSLTTGVSCLLLPFLWKSLGRDITYIGVSLFLFFFIGGFGSVMSMKIKKSLGGNNIIHYAVTGTWLMLMLFILTVHQPFLSMAAFVGMGFITMSLVPANICLAQRSVPEYKSVAGGIMNGFTWGAANILVASLGFAAQRFGILPIIFVCAFVPLSCNLLVKYLNPVDAD